jgi:hypothetical protein
LKVEKKEAYFLIWTGLTGRIPTKEDYERLREAFETKNERKEEKDDRRD